MPGASGTKLMPKTIFPWISKFDIKNLVFLKIDVLNSGHNII